MTTDNANASHETLLRCLAESPASLADVARTCGYSLDELATLGSDPQVRRKIEGLVFLANAGTQLYVSQHRAIGGAKLMEVADMEPGETSRRGCNDLFKINLVPVTPLPPPDPAAKTQEEITPASHAEVMEALVNLARCNPAPDREGPRPTDHGLPVRSGATAGHNLSPLALILMLILASAFASGSSETPRGGPSHHQYMENTRMPTEIAPSVVAELIRHRPMCRGSLHSWLWGVLDISVPRTPRCANHSSPMDYLEHAFFERPGAGDSVVWANRGGGKTFYGAVATLLDMIFKPGIEVRILGGSLDQSSRMYEHLRKFIDRPALRPLVKGNITQRGFELTNGSRVELLAQSQTSVRGTRVQKLRCDEVELFDREVWEAAQLTTRSETRGGIEVRGSIEAFSTMHKRRGIMSELVGKVDRLTGESVNWPIHQLTSQPVNQSTSQLYHWCVLDVMSKCELPIDCPDCRIFDACRGRAREFDGGFISAHDVVTQRSRLAAGPFDVEMLCQGVNTTHLVLPEFNPAVHVQPIEPDRTLTWVGGMDFGMRNPHVMLWAQLRPIANGTGAPPGKVAPPGPLRVEVIDEYIVSDRVITEHLAAMKLRGWPHPRWIAADPSGDQRSTQTGLGNIDVVRRAGYNVKALRAPVQVGINILRNRLTPIENSGGEPKAKSHEPEAGNALLLVHPRCRQLIDALSEYHYDEKQPACEDPVKDGPDHCVDALRYMVVALEKRGEVVVVRY